MPCYRCQQPYSSNTTAPYRGFAGFYDRVTGHAVTPYVWGSFRRSLGDFGIGFRSAADVGCGTGTFLMLLARLNVRPLYGVDLSTAMLHLAGRKNRGNNLRLSHGDIRDLRLPERVDLITCNGDTLNYLVSKSQLGRALWCCRANLRKGGHLLFDLITGSRNPWPAGTVIQEIRLPEVFSQWRITTDSRRGLSVAEIDSRFRDAWGRHCREKEVHVQRWYPVQTILQLLRRVGLSLRGTFDMGTGQPADSASFWVKFIARKAC